MSRVSYLDVKASVLARIRGGELAPGDTVPGEAALADEFGCARVTVNRALRELAEAGVVERRRKAGTRVLDPSPRDASMEIPSVRAEIEATGAAYRYELLGRRLAVPPAEVRAALDVAAGEKALHLRCRHWAGGRAHQFEDRWINLETVPKAREADFAASGPNDWLIRAVPLTQVEHVFSAANATPEEAALLGIAPGDAVFVAERRTWLGARPVTRARLVHPGATYRLVARTLPPL
ncbi:MAG TPA: UTRA domain-containing protein [Thermohalobaculum sp.]|nr:UTRA domain-containing protein [Thermohalobaculum sp.]